MARFRFLESDQQKIRPVIVIGRPYGKLQILLAIPVSSAAKAESIDVTLKNRQATGLLKPSVARIHRLSAILKDDLIEEIGIVDEKHAQAIKQALKELLNL